jgi:hypothetical protein
VVNVRFNKSNEKIVTIGESNEDKIFEFIEKNKGVHPYEIRENVNIKSKLTRQTIHVHLRNLLKKKKIYKNKENGKYYAEDPYLGNINNFARYMNEVSGMLITPDLIDPQTEEIPSTYTISPPSTVYVDLCKAVRGVITVSNNYCKTKFTQGELYEKYLFEFVNRIGAFMAYIFIEVMRPLSEFNSTTVGMPADKKDKLSTVLIDGAINPKEMFEHFCDLFMEAGLIKTDSSKRFFELDRNCFNKMSETFKKVYPSIYEGLEKYWLSSIDNSVAWETGLARETSCEHKWEDFRAYKIDKQYYLCRKCGLLSNSRVMDQKL